MSKTILDYSNTIVYKISCKNTAISDVYVGHTTNFVQRKQSHRCCCNNTVSSDHQPKLYQTIREYGGWDNWNMEIIAFRNCKDLYEARLFEQEYYDSLGATLNSVLPLPPPTPTSRTCEGRSNKPAILVSDNNKKIKTDTQLSAKYSCVNCNYHTSRKSQYERHLLTVKHTQMINNDGIVQHCSMKYVCHCGKKYKYRQGLFAHRKSCVDKMSEEPTTTSNNTSQSTQVDMSMVLEILKQNQVFKDMLIEQNKQIMEIVNMTQIPWQPPN